jgi:isopenicillin N synthase-like dioxygenase
MKLDINQTHYHRGYEDFGSQMLEQGTAPESKEGLYLGKDLQADHPDVIAGKFGSGPNLWPAALGEEFKKTCNEYYEDMYR